MSTYYVSRVTVTVCQKKLLVDASKFSSSKLLHPSVRQSDGGEFDKSLLFSSRPSACQICPVGRHPLRTHFYSEESNTSESLAPN